MIAWTLLIGSGLALTIMFLNQLRKTRKDVAFQKNMFDEDNAVAETPVEENLEEEEPVGSIRHNFMKGDYHMGRREYDLAEQYFLSVLKADEGHLDTHHKLGLMFMKIGDFPQAELYFSKLVNLKKDPVYFSNLGASLYQQQRLIEAAEAYENAVALDDKRAERLQSLAQVYHELGDSEKALKYFESAAKRKPKDNDLRMILVDYYERMDRPQDALDILDKILFADPYNEEAKARLAEIRKRVNS